MKRWDIDSEQFGNADVLIESEDGDYIEWEDAKELADEVVRLRKLLWNLSNPPKYLPRAKDVKQFREEHGCSLIEANSILSTAFGDMELAAELLRKRGV